MQLLKTEELYLSKCYCLLCFESVAMDGLLIDIILLFFFVSRRGPGEYEDQTGETGSEEASRGDEAGGGNGLR